LSGERKVGYMREMINWDLYQLELN